MCVRYSNLTLIKHFKILESMDKKKGILFAPLAKKRFGVFISHLTHHHLLNLSLSTLQCKMLVKCVTNLSSPWKFEPWFKFNQMLSKVFFPPCNLLMIKSFMCSNIILILGIKLKFIIIWVKILVKWSFLLKFVYLVYCLQWCF